MEVLITTPSFGRQSNEPWEALDDAGVVVRRPQAAHPLDPTQLANEASDVPAIIVGLDEVDKSVFSALPSLKVVAKHGVGVDNIDLDAARAAGVRVVNAPGANAGAVADLTLGAMLSIARQLPAAHRSMLEGRWETFPGVELGGRKLGILGFGRIGQGVAQRARAFGMEVVAYDPYVPDEVMVAAGVKPDGLDEVVAIADFLTLHLPGDPDAAPLLSPERMESMKRGVFLINAARGGLIDEGHLVKLLADGHVAGAALDAFAQEPLGKDHPLLSAGNVLLTPHIGAYTDRANAAMGTSVAHDVARVLRGEEPVNAVV
ncbi:phosphoglycerate dehydrogenase [Micrococcaceae bacterium RIT802]|nr:phosphoglycerate dehydrogenase [Micrococcaceae bacterium RIT 802]